MLRKSLFPAVAFVATALVFALPDTGLSMLGPFSVTGTTWNLTGKIKAKVKGLGKQNEDATATVRFLTDSLLELEDSGGNLFTGDYTGGQIDEDGKGSKKIVVTLTPTQLEDAAAEIADFAAAIASANGLPGITPDIEITKHKVKGKLAKNGELLKADVKFNFIASALGQSAKGSFRLKGKGPQASDEQ